MLRTTVRRLLVNNPALCHPKNFPINSRNSIRGFTSSRASLTTSTPFFEKKILAENHFSPSTSLYRASLSAPFFVPFRSYGNEAEKTVAVKFVEKMKKEVHEGGWVSFIFVRYVWFCVSLILLDQTLKSGFSIVDSVYAIVNGRKEPNPWSVHHRIEFGKSGKSKS